VGEEGFEYRIVRRHALLAATTAPLLYPCYVQASTTFLSAQPAKV